MFDENQIKKDEKRQVLYTNLLEGRAAPILVSVSVPEPIPGFFDGIGIGQVGYTSTNSVACLLLTINTIFSKLSS